MDIRRKVLRESMVNYLYDNSILYINFENYRHNNKNAKKCNFQYNDNLKNIIINYMLLKEAQIEKKINKKTIQAYEKAYENGLIDYSELSINIKKQMLAFNNKIMRFINSNLNTYLTLSLNDFSNEELLNYFNENFDLSYNQYAEKIINTILKESINNYDKSLKIIKLIYENEMYNKHISDEEITDVKKWIIERYLNNEELYNYIIKEFESVQSKRKKSMIKPISDSIKNTHAQNNQIEYINKITIINSSHNHVTLHHHVEDTRVLIDYNNGHQLMPLKFNVHFCKECGVFFDFKDSFYAQNIEYDFNRLILNINELKDKEYLFVEKTIHLDKSLLSMLDYRVGLSGKTKEDRKRILKYSLESGLYTVGELKSHLEFCINYFKNKPTMEKAIEDWEEDMQYIALHQHEFDYSNKKYK